MIFDKKALLEYVCEKFWKQKYDEALEIEDCVLKHEYVAGKIGKE